MNNYRLSKIKGLTPITLTPITGASPESVARMLHAERRALGVKYKDLTPKDKLRQITERNIQKYNDPLGPSIDFLRGKGKSWDDIIESASRSGGKDLGF